MISIVGYIEEDKKKGNIQAINFVSHGSSFDKELNCFKRITTVNLIMKRRSCKSNVINPISPCSRDFRSSTSMGIKDQLITLNSK